MRFPLVPMDMPPVVRAYINQLIGALTKELNSRKPDIEARADVLLQSSGGFIYSVTVDDAGTLTTTLVKQP